VPDTGKYVVCEYAYLGGTPKWKFWDYHRARPKISHTRVTTSSMKMPILFGLVCIVLFSLPSWGQETVGQRCANGKLSTEVAELAQAVTQRNAPLAPDETLPSFTSAACRGGKRATQIFPCQSATDPKARSGWRLEVQPRDVEPFAIARTALTETALLQVTAASHSWRSGEIYTSRFVDRWPPGHSPLLRLVPIVTQAGKS